MKANLRKLKYIPLLFVLLLTACGGAKEKELALTSVAQTLQIVEAQSTAIAETILQLTKEAEEAAKTPTVEAATSTPIPAAVTPLASITPASAAAQVPAAGSNFNNTTGDRAEFVSETIPDGTKFAPGATFTKSWQLVNKGSTTWSTSYSLVFSGGDTLSDKTSVNLPYAVAPNQVVEVSVAMKAPTTNGTYKSNWVMRNASGTDFGIGSSGVNPVWVQIEVGTASGTAGVTPTGGTQTVTSTPDPSIVFAVTNLTDIAYDPKTGIDCTKPEFDLSANIYITTNKAGSVAYQWVLDGAPVGSGTKSFSSASTDYVNFGPQKYPITPPGKTGILEFKVTSPNVTSKPVNMAFACK